MFPTCVCHVPGIADHTTVIYEFDSLFQIPVYHSPRRCRFASELSQQTIQTAFEQSWDTEVFEKCLSTRDLNQAFTILSDHAECALSQIAYPNRHSQKHVPRSALWQPSVKVAPSKSASQVESVLLRRLRRLQRRLQHLLRVPHDVSLHENCDRNLASLSVQIPELTHWVTLTTSQTLDIVNIVTARLDEAEKQQRISTWRQQTHGSLAKQTAWIKRRCSIHAEIDTHTSTREVVHAIHPSEVAKEQQRAWMKHWCPTTSVSIHPVCEILDSLAAHRQHTTVFDIEWTGGALLKIARAMTLKASGPDDWGAIDLIKLPLMFWDALAKIWELVYRSGCIPEIWTFARVALLPKSDNEWRPLSIASIFWRIGSRHIVQCIRPWINTWLNPHVFGAAPGRAVSHALLRVLDAARAQPDQILIAQDLSKFFDCVEVEHACCVARFLGAPIEFCNLITNFYSAGHRVFSCNGVLSNQWIHPTRGIMQGCPLSPVIACMLMHVWSIFITRHHDIDAVCYIDDRTFWANQLRPFHSRIAALRRAVESSNRFDTAFGLTCRKSKCHIATLLQTEVTDFVDELQYPCSPVLQILGVQFSFHDLNYPQLYRFNLSTIQQLVSLIHCVALTFRDRQLLIASLIISKCVWAAGIATPSEEDLDQVRQCIFKAFGGRVLLHDSAKPILTEVMSWKIDPSFATEWAALRTACKFRASPPPWAPNLANRAFVLFPKAAQVLERLNWQIDQAVTCIHRVDASGHSRKFDIGWDSPSIIFQWLLHAHRSIRLSSCRRVRESLHREHADATAVGLNLPGIPPDVVCHFAGHQQCFYDIGASLRLRQASLASGGSFWSCNFGKRLLPNDPKSKCMCGLVFPSRPHLVWNCPVTADLRCDIIPPQNRVEERLFARCISEMPAPPPVPDNQVFNSLCESILCIGQQTSVVHIATDGSSKHNVGAWSIVLQGNTHGFAGPLGCEDQSSFRCEVEAFLVLLAAILHCVGRPGCPDTFVVLSDCQEAIRVVEGASCFSPLLAKRAHELLLEAKLGGVDIQICWVPAHGRVVSSWIPPPTLSEHQCRELNEMADLAAKQVMQDQLRGSPRDTWFRQCAIDKVWEVSVIHLAVAAAERYRNFVDRG